MDGLPERLRCLDAALKSNNVDQIGEAALRLKGAAITLGAETLADLCGELEKSIVVDHTIDGQALRIRIMKEGERVQAAARRILSTPPPTTRPEPEGMRRPALRTIDAEMAVKP